MNLSEFNIADLIPQRPPMQMIDKLINADERSATGCLVVRDSNIFTHNNRLSESALVEFIAQTAAAYTGFNNKINKAAVTEGYIGAVKNLVVTGVPETGSEIFCEIEVINEIVGFTIINGKVILDGKVIASCEMRILSR